jgi:hypothetical protein
MKKSEPKPIPQKPLKARDKLEAYGMDQICEHIRLGKSLDYCATDIGVSWSTLTLWINENPAKIEQYARAREERAHKLADDMLEVANRSCLTEVFKGEEVVIAINPALVQQNKLIIDTMKWSASKLLPRVYADKIDVTSGGEALGFADYIKQLAQK